MFHPGACLQNVVLIVDWYWKTQLIVARIPELYRIGENYLNVSKTARVLLFSLLLTVFVDVMPPGPTLMSSQDWIVIWNCKPNKPFFPNVVFIHWYFIITTATKLEPPLPCIYNLPSHNLQCYYLKDCQKIFPSFRIHRLWQRGSIDKVSKFHTIDLNATVSWITSSEVYLLPNTCVLHSSPFYDSHGSGHACSYNLWWQ